MGAAKFCAHERAPAAGEVGLRIAETFAPRAAEAPAPVETRLPLDSALCTAARESIRRLGETIPQPCSERELKGVFRRLALRYHPDRNPAPEAARAFASLVEAYEALLEPFEVARKS